MTSLTVTREGPTSRIYDTAAIAKIRPRDIAGAELVATTSTGTCKAKIEPAEVRLQEISDASRAIKYEHLLRKWNNNKCDQKGYKGPARRHRCKILGQRIQELTGGLVPLPPSARLREAASAADAAAQRRIDALKAPAPAPAPAVPVTDLATAAKDAADRKKTAQDAAKAAAKARALANAAMLLAPASAAGASATPGTAQDVIDKERSARDEEAKFQTATKAADAAARVLAAYQAREAAAAALQAAKQAEQSTGIERRAHEATALAALKRAEEAAALADRADAASKPKSDEEKKDNRDDKKEPRGPDDTPKEKSDSEKDLDRLKAGKLMAWGVTAGVAPTLYQPLISAGGRRALPEMGALTYLMLLPGYWRNEPETNIYCANKWAGRASVAAAARAADDLSAERAQLIVDRLLDHARAGGLQPGDATAVMCTDGRCAGDEHRIRELTEAALGTDEAAKAARRVLIAHVQRSTYDWRAGITTSCASRRVGIWFGYPLKFKTTIPYRADMQVRRERMEVTPIFAGGFGWSPNAYVSLLAGISLGKVNLPPGADRDDEFVASFLFGIGGNLDLVNLFTK